MTYFLENFQNGIIEKGRDTRLRYYDLCNQRIEIYYQDMLSAGRSDVSANVHTNVKMNIMRIYGRGFVIASILGFSFNGIHGADVPGAAISSTWDFPP